MSSNSDPTVFKNPSWRKKGLQNKATFSFMFPFDSSDAEQIQLFWVGVFYQSCRGLNMPIFHRLGNSGYTTTIFPSFAKVSKVSRTRATSRAALDGTCAQGTTTCDPPGKKENHRLKECLHMGVNPKILVFTPQIIHLFIGFGFPLF